MKNQLKLHPKRRTKKLLRRVIRNLLQRIRLLSPLLLKKFKPLSQQKDLIRRM